MTETDAETPTQPAAVPRRWDWRPKVRWFAAEILVVVAGVLIALALNAWWGARQDAASERTYLVLLSRDLGQMADDLRDLAAFEDQQFQHALRAYRILSASAPTEDERASASESLSLLLSRRTVNTTDPTYQDLLSTGSLRLLRDRTLRDRVVAFYEETERLVDIHNKNNAVFVDGLFVREMLGRGLLYNRTGSDATIQARPDSILHAVISPGYADGPDPLWQRPPASADWDMVRAVLIERLLVAAYAREFAEVHLAEARDLRRAVEAEVRR